MVEVLYKYGRLNEQSEQLFSGSKLYFASPRELNDPFECDPRVLATNLSDNAYRSYLLKKVKKQGGTTAEAKAHAREKIRSRVHRNENTWANIRADMKAQHNSLGLYCLSEVCDQILMWSHYADGYRGYCIEFAATDSTLIFGYAQKVHYQDEYPVIDFCKRDRFSWAKSSVLTKYTEWSYEKEWRIVYPEKGMKDYQFRLMLSVIFGAMMTQGHKAKIRQWLSLRPGTVGLKQARIHGSRYALEIADLSS